MNDLPSLLRHPESGLVVRLVCVPAGLHLFLTLIGAGGEHSLFMLLAVIVAAALSGSYLEKFRHGPIETALCSAWPTTFAVWRRWHWALSMPSPGGAAQSLVDGLGWPNPSMTGAVAALTAGAGLGGWLFSRWSEMKPQKSRAKWTRTKRAR